MARSHGWIVTTSTERPIEDVAQDLRDSGFTVGQILEDVGCITGTACHESAARLESIAGVLDVSPGVPVDMVRTKSTFIW